MNIKAIIGSGLVTIGLGVGAVYWLSQPSDTASLYQDDGFVSVTSVESSPSTGSTPLMDQSEAVQPTEVVEELDVDQTSPVVEPEIVADKPIVEIEAPSEVIEPVIVERDPAEATERGLTVTMYPSWRNDLFTLSWHNSIENADSYKEAFTHNDVPLGVYISKRALLLEEDISTTGIKPPPGGMHIAKGFIDFKEDGYYYIYPVDGLVKPWIFAPWPSLRGVVTSLDSSIQIKIGSETVFDGFYEKNAKRSMNKAYFKKGRYPIEVIFSQVFMDGFYGIYSNGKTFSGVDIMVYKTEDAHDRYLDFVFQNKRRAMLSTFPLKDNSLDQAYISSPTNFKYIDWENDITEQESSSTYTNINPNDKPRVFGFTFTPKVEGEFAIGQKIYADKRTMNASPNYKDEQHSCRIWLHKVNNERINVYNKRDDIITGNTDDITVLSTFQSEGSAVIIDVKKSMINAQMDIQMAYWCKFQNRESYPPTPLESYTLIPLLKTPGNNSFLPLEDFAE